ncbi:MAG: peptidoglycan DD-metalloendopeptidase family protein [Prolixibacteraceae bacterium]
MKFNVLQKIGRLKKILIWSFVLLMLLQVVYYVYEYFDTKRLERELAEEKEAVKPEPLMLFNLPVDSVKIIPGSIRSGQNLSEILSARGISMGQIDEIAKKSVLTFDVRKMKVNNNYYFLMNKMDSSKVDYFIYEIDPINYVVYQLADSLRIYRDKKPITTLVKTASGEITSSLWNAMTAQALNTGLVMELADIYQWTIDFYGIQKGDKFKLIFEENFVSGKSVGTGRIFAAQFTHNGEEFYAFRFTQNNEDSYFDHLGKSLKTAFLKAPLKFSRISSQFSNNRFHPVLKIYRPHHGVDYAAPTGTPVVSIGDGTVVAKGYQASGGGNYLKIKHNSAYTTSYMHLKGFAPGVSQGVRVKQGQLIGYVGSTGLSSGPHLDFRVYFNGSAINPLSMKAPPTDPIFEKNKESYAIHLDSMMTKLTAIKSF